MGQHCSDVFPIIWAWFLRSTDQRFSNKQAPIVFNLTCNMHTETLSISLRVVFSLKILALILSVFFPFLGFKFIKDRRQTTVGQLAIRRSRSSLSTQGGNCSSSFLSNVSRCSTKRSLHCLHTWNCNCVRYCLPLRNR